MAGCTRDDYGKKGLCVHCILEIEKYTSNELELKDLKKQIIKLK